MESMANGKDKDSRQESSLDLAMFDYWQKEHVMFIPTTACEEVENLIKKKSLVIVVGLSGSGKSAIIQHIALKYRSESWAVKPVTGVDEILKAYESNNILPNKTLFVINDPIGKESFDEMAFASWKNDTEKQKDGVKFFTEPVKKIKEEICAFKYECQEKYCALILIVLFNNALCVGDLRNDKNSEKLYEHALKLCGMSTNTAPLTIHEALETLKDVFVSKIGNAYQFCHDLVMEVTSYVFGSDYPRDMIKYADIVFLRKRVKLEDQYDKTDQFTISISDRHLDSLAERLLKEIVGKKIVDVVLNPLLKEKKVADALIKNIENDKTKIETLFVKLFVKKELLLENQNFNEKSTDFFFSKLDFLSLNCNVSPVCALIVFSHADLSIYCLKALQQLPSNFKDSSVFFAVCCNGTIDLFNMFSDDEIKTYLKEKCGYLYPIHIVSLLHNYEMLQKLIDFGVDVDQRDMYGDTALIFAVKNITELSEDSNSNPRQYQTLQLLLCNDADIDLCNEFGRSPFCVACENGHASTLQLLVRNGADINLCDKLGRSPLYIACKNGHANTLQLVLRRETDIKFCNAVRNSLSKLIDVRDKLNNRDLREFGLSLLHIACFDGNGRTVQLLLEHGTDINLCDTFGNSPLYIACQNTHGCIVQLLLRYKADINLCNKFGYSPLYIACYNACYKRDYSTVQLLLKHGADTNLSDTFGNKPLDVACLNRCNSIVQLLLNHGADINSCD